MTMRGLIGTKRERELSVARVALVVEGEFRVNLGEWTQDVF